ncbi:MAG: DUF5060 domain-containing protein [Kiritimatiellae bacterium]|nr:DUF5060 domain-containing protein [Kiritimatiellia bacterium]
MSVWTADAATGPEVEGELKQWHAVSLTFRGPVAAETDDDPNPFRDYRLVVTFRHEGGAPPRRVPGYFAADGRAAQTGADRGDAWRVKFSPDLPGRWEWRVEFVRGRGAAIRDVAGEPVLPWHGLHGELEIGLSDKSPPDLRARGRLVTTGTRYRRFAGDGSWFLKAGPDAPETLLAFADFDGTEARRHNAPLKTWAPHWRDWRPGDPLWRGDRGKGLIGALNYLAAVGLNTVSMLLYNAGGDGDNVWPFRSRDDKWHYDCSKLDQWQLVFEHAARRGLHLHLKLQETENDDDRPPEKRASPVATSLDGGRTGPERRLYLREMVARFGHLPALTWNLGEECTLSTEEIAEMARYLRMLDSYGHHVVVHTYPGQQERVYRPLLGRPEVLTGVSLQNHWNATHRLCWQWICESTAAGHPWVVANDEQNPAELGVPPDEGWNGFDGVARPAGSREGGQYTRHDIRRYCLWGALMAGAEGVEYYFGYQLPQTDLDCEDFRSRERSWADARRALEFFRREAIPVDEMRNLDELVANPKRSNTAYCFAKPDALYLVYLPRGGTITLDLSRTSGRYRVWWFNPRADMPMLADPRREVEGGARVALGPPPAEPDEDWLAVIRRQ